MGSAGGREVVQHPIPALRSSVPISGQGRAGGRTGAGAGARRSEAALGG